VLNVCGTARVVAHLLGYARVSTTEQNPDLQVDELRAARVLEGVDGPGVGGGGPSAGAR
jgi:predicted site-specific integrase-resolvase